jgi:hypothetical protein
MLARALFLLSLLTVPAPAQRRGPAPIAIASTSQLTVDGGQIRNETFSLSQAQGDWFVTANDAHASLTLKTAAPKPPVTLDVRWFGKQPSRVINAGNNTDMTGDRVTFMLLMNGQEPYNIAAKPRGDDSITVTVTRMDDHDLEARIVGAAEKLRINATVSLHRDALPSRPMTATYGACEPVIYDKMYGAQSRSPSECEVRFESDVYRAIRQSLDRVMAWFRTADWVVTKESEPKPIVSAARGTEKNPFRLDFTSNGAYSVIARMNPASAQSQAYRKQFEDLMQKLQGRGGVDAAALQDIQSVGYQTKGATEVNIGVSINPPSAGLANFKGEHTMLNVPGSAYAVFSAHAQAATGGGIDASEDRALILLGAWEPAAIQKQSDGGEQISIKPAFDKSASMLSVQTIVIRINANQELVRNILRQIDLTPLQALLRK